MNAREAPRPLLFEAEESRLAALDRLAVRQRLGGATNSQGTLESRLEALAALRAAFIAGGLPPRANWLWPAPPIAQRLHDVIIGLELAGYCRDQTELADTVLMSILFHLDFIVDYRDRGAGEGRAVQMAIDGFAAEWQERCGQIQELVDVFGMLPDGDKNMRWDQIRGLLRSSGWQDVLRIRRLLERLPELVRIIRGLGRTRPAEDSTATATAAVDVLETAVAQRPERRTVRVPDMPGETRGIHRSGRIARMLPAEAMLLAHPRSRLVWHARRAERTLLAYEDDDRMEEIRLHKSPVTRPRPGPQASTRFEAGPMLICVDTSGSMQGGAMAVAKAAVLEAMRAAHAQRRACRVFAFGGPDEIVDFELHFDNGGIERLIGFLGQSFGGGTDICGPLEKVIGTLEEQRWRYADLLVVSDGEFGATADVVGRLEAVKRELGLRVQGVLVGDRETVGFLEVADHIYPVRDWRRYGGAAVDAPIPSPHLTAMFFPGALRNAENRLATVSGEAASAVLLAVRKGAKAARPPDADEPVA